MDIDRDLAIWPLFVSRKKVQVRPRETTSLILCLWCYKLHCSSHTSYYSFRNFPLVKTPDSKGRIKWTSCFFASCSADALQRHCSRGQLCWGWCNPRSLLQVRTDTAENSVARNELELKFCHILGRLGDLLVRFPKNGSSGQSSFPCELLGLD